MIDLATFENYITNCSQARFDAIAKLLLHEVFHLDVTNVDGTGDGGGDFVILPRDGGKRAFVSQVTVQKQNWEAKALEDARRSVHELDCSRFFFLTTRKHSSVKLRQLEGTITQEHHIPASCLGGKEIADMLHSQDLEVEALDVMGIPMPTTKRIDQSEMLLHGYVALGNETASLRDQVYDDTIFLVLKYKGKLTHDNLITEAIAMLGCDLSRESRIKGRIDSLLSRGLLSKDPDSKLFFLSDSAMKKLSVSERIYADEMNALAVAQASLIEKEFNIEWPPESAQKSSVLVARAFIKNHLDTIQTSQVAVNKLQLTSQIGDPLQELRDFLQSSGIPPKKINSVMAEFADNASSSPVIQKLIRGVLYAALEGQNSLRASRVLGVSSWSQVTVVLDASVLIPYLCTKLFGPTSGRFSLGAICSVDALSKAGARLVTTQDYVNEVATHLLKAMDFRRISNADKFLADSTNGYVAHYYQALLDREGSMPKTLQSFLSKFSLEINNERPPQKWIRAIMVDIQRLASKYGIEYEHVKSVDSQYSDPVDREYGFIQSERGYQRESILFEHDARALSYLRKIVATGDSGVMCLTWDRLMISVAKKVSGCGWVISPHDAADFIQLSNPPTGEKLISLSHDLAGMREKPSELVAGLLENIVKVADPSLLGWQLVDKLDSLEEALAERIDTYSDEYNEWARHQLSAVLEDVTYGISDNPDADT